MKAFLHFLANHKYLTAVGAIFLFAGVGVAVASIPDTNGVIHGCYKNSTGMLKVIDNSTQSCLSGETALNWNQTGPQGPTGQTGATGPQGPAGADATSLWAVVDSSGNLTRGSGAISSSADSQAHVYVVVFNQNIQQCAYSATPMSGSTDDYTTEVAAYGDGDSIEVQHLRPNGDFALHAFSLAVFC